MQSVQRHFGRYMKRSADENQVGVLLKDFEDADHLLTRIIEASKAWRESWISILTYQHRLFTQIEILYQPIIGATDDYQGHVPAFTDDKKLKKVERIKVECDDLKKDLQHELGIVDMRMIKPAQNAKDSLQMFRKTIKKREDKKLDFERYQNRVDTAMKKTKRSDRDNISLQKSQSDLLVATEAYNAADERLRSCLPSILTSVFSLLPHLLAAQIQIQNAMLAHYYTVLHTYCTEEGFPSPSPPMDEVIRYWEDAFKPIQQEAESIAILASGKAVRMPMTLENGHATAPTNGYRRPSTHSLSRGHSVSPARALPPSPSYDPKPKTLSTSPSSISLLNTPSEPILTSPSPSLSSYHTPMGFSPAGPTADYFSRDRQPSSTSINSLSTNHTTHNNTSTSQLTTTISNPLPSSSANSSTSALSSLLATKKRPPPPPPRAPSQTRQFSYVTALYDFPGQGEGDLSFREGDKIKVLKKTESTDDWWHGELRGIKGQFPANYCQ